MSFPVSPSTAFASIDWSTLENRPPIDKQQFCTEKNWHDDVPCCISGYTVEHILESAEENGLSNTPEAQFLSEYPCINGVEMNYFYERLTGLRAPEKPRPSADFLSNIFNGIKNLFL